MKYPKGTKFNPWTLNRQRQRGVERWAIWRWVKLPDGKAKLERLPVSKYKLIRENETELRKLVVRLNDQVSREDRAKEKIQIRHAFIDTALLDEYRDYLIVQIPSKAKATTNYYYLVKYFLNFFINELQMNDPLQWHSVHETKWAKYLVSNNVPASADTKKHIVASANRFMAWLHKKRPSEVPPLVFKPLTASKYKEIEAQRKLSGEAKVRKFVNDNDWKNILKKAPDDIKPAIELAYRYGLRRSEALGLTTEDIRSGFLSIERQLLRAPEGQRQFGPLKGREARKCPHWFSTPAETFKLITENLKYPMHPDTLTDRWNDLMSSMKLDYDIHDLRHTWVTRAIREKNPRDVQLAAGHKNIQTTMKYAHDDRELENAVWKPEQAG